MNNLCRCFPPGFNENISAIPCSIYFATSKQVYAMKVKYITYHTCIFSVSANWFLPMFLPNSVSLALITPAIQPYFLQQIFLQVKSYLIKVSNLTKRYHKLQLHKVTLSINFRCHPAKHLVLVHTSLMVL